MIAFCGGVIAWRRELAGDRRRIGPLDPLAQLWGNGGPSHRAATVWLKYSDALAV